MTMQRHSAYYSGDPSKIGLWPDPDGAWVLYTDAEAAITAAIAEERQRFDDDGAERDIRQQTIRDCIAAVEFLHDHNPDQAAGLWAAICELRALGGGE